MDDFVSWLNNKTREKGWSNNELARRAGITGAGVSNVINGKYSVTFDFCAGIAKALNMPAEDVFRRAGLLPPAPTISNEKVQIIIDLARNMPEPLLDLWLEQGRVIYRQKSELLGEPKYIPMSQRKIIHDKE